MVGLVTSLVGGRDNDVCDLTSHLHGGVHDQALELGRLDGLAVHGGVDGGLEEFFAARLADGGPKAPDLGGITRKARLVVGHAAEVLPHDVLGPTLHKFLVAELVDPLICDKPFCCNRRCTLERDRL